LAVVLTWALCESRREAVASTVRAGSDNARGTQPSKKAAA
jgi:cytochrome c oxidase assembly protein subunit 15